MKYDEKTDSVSVKTKGDKILLNNSIDEFGGLLMDILNNEMSDELLHKKLSRMRVLKAIINSYVESDSGVQNP